MLGKLASRKAVVELTGHQIGTGGWQYAELPENIEAEKSDREKLAEIFRWPQEVK